ncbi:MAG TPA: motility associated factor glycosyltransferase family protein [Bacillales bacterium]|nr:motility associated factor glycosyltransferase family protein [Bacillales bacterium]
MQVDNINYLRQYHRHILETLRNYENQEKDTNIEIINSKQGLKTIQVVKDGRTQFIHSKYDPKNETEKLIDQFGEEISNYEHVLFYGVGFGYHIEEFMNRFPHFTFSIYEPVIDIFYEFTNHCSINSLPVHRLKDIFIETSREEGNRFLTALTERMQERILLVVLPSYERIYQEQYRFFSEAFKEAVQAKRNSYYIDTTFSARWTLNSLINFPKTISTPNILDGFDSNFKNKPLIIVSAGPSLEDEYDNLRYIKENKLAYIFAVGSANRALIAQKIMPDAVCTYDPQEHNYNVFASIIEQGITSIPLIFGTSVGFETLDWYQGPKLHMVTSQDTIAQYYIQKRDQTGINIIYDSPTIAAVTFQLGARLGCNPVIFVGQNLAFKNNQFYSKDVEYNKKNRPIQVIEQDRQNILLVDDVYGNHVETTPSFNNMKENIEWYISQSSEVEVINTTKGGAAIAGTVFQPLEELIKERLKSPAVVENWYESTVNNYNLLYTSERITKMEHSIKEFRKLYKEILYIFEDIQRYIKSKNESKLLKNIMKFDKLMKKIIVNDCYVNYIQPVNRTLYQALSIRAANIRKQTSEVDRAKLIIESFYPYLDRCNQTLEQIVGSVYHVHGELQEIIEPESKSYKFYSSDCGVFHYEGEWDIKNYGPGKTIGFRIHQHVSQKKGALIRFKFLGTSLRIYGFKSSNGSEDIEIIIDGEKRKFSRKNYHFHFYDTHFNKQLLVEIKSLKNTDHIVEIKLQDDNLLIFSGVEIDVDCRAFHIDEETEFKNLTIGKRIRCHYKTNYNNVGQFSGIGKETSAFIPIEATAFSCGDFYFVMVDDVNGEKKLIADRNIQHSISWETLYESRIATAEGLQLKFKSISTRLRLITGGKSPEDLENEWDKYIVSSKKFQNSIDTFNSNFLWSLTLTNPNHGITSFRFGDTNKDSRVIRGGTPFEHKPIKTGYDALRFDVIHKDLGFRPLLLVKL